jgi:hypothetical protein
MKPPENAEIHDEPTSVWWIDESGIFCSVSKPNPIAQTREEGMKRLEEFKASIGHKKICMLIDISNAKPGAGSREDRDLAAIEMAKLVKAMALIAKTALSKMVMNLFFSLKPPPYPYKMFSPEQEQEAKEWLKQYL